MQPKFIVNSGRSAGRGIAIKRQKLLIGRAEECDVRPLSEEVSRRHCEIVHGSGEVTVEDLGSRNGTFVNGRKIEVKTTLADGDILRIGSLELKFAAGTPQHETGSEQDVSRWLMADDSEPAGLDTTHAIRSQDDAAPQENSAEPQSADSHEPPPEDISSTRSTIHVEEIRQSKEKPGSLPGNTKKQAESSRDAAAEALKKFFGNR